MRESTIEMVNGLRHKYNHFKLAKILFGIPFSLLIMDVDVLPTISVEDLIQDFLQFKKVGGTFSNINKEEECKDKHNFLSCCLVSFK